MKTLTNKKIWLFAVGQLGWSMLSGLISNWLVYFYQPNQSAQDAGQTVFIPQGLAVLGIATIIGANYSLCPPFRCLYRSAHCLPVRQMQIPQRAPRSVS